MPEGEKWSGVYYHPVFGYLHMVEEGRNLIGRWKRSDQSSWGELSGTTEGNVARFTWKEHKVGLVGPASESRGKGYFVYKFNEGNKIGELDGEYGVGDDEAGSSWHCVKQARVQPDLKSINGDTGAAVPGAEKWN
jgi:hypothetical protein